MILNSWEIPLMPSRPIVSDHPSRVQICRSSLESAEFSEGDFEELWKMRVLPGKTGAAHC
jgi:hypothetical protein